MHKLTNTNAIWILILLTVTACSPQAGSTFTAEPPVTASTNSSPEAAEELQGKLLIYSGRSEALIQPVIDAFQKYHPQVEVLLKAGSNSELANALLEEKNNPQADIFITTELFTIQTLAQQGIFQAYLPKGAENIPDEFISPDQTWISLTRRLRVIMYNTNLVSTEELPGSIFDLVDPKWKGQIATAGSTNGSMQAQIAAMRQLLGEQETQEWLQGLIDNDVTFFGGHTDVRKAVGAGEFKLGLVNHYYYYLQQAENSPVGVIYPDQGDGQIGLFTNTTSAAIIQGAANSEAAQTFLDFIISPEGQALFAELNYEYPVLPGVELHPSIQPLSEFSFASVDVARAALDSEATFDLMERIGLP